VYLVARFADMAYHDRLHHIWGGSWESYLFMVEMGFGLILPLFIIFSPLANNRGWLIVYGCLTVFGVVLNRANVVIFGMKTGIGSVYIPSIPETLLTLALITGGFLVYMVVVENYNVLWDAEKQKPVVAG